MNLFLVGDRGDAGRAVDVLEALRSPFLTDGVMTRLPGGACLAHPPERVGGVEHAVVDEDRFALFAGRPIRWEGDHADGRSVLDPALYFGGVPAGMDGRFAVVRSDGGALEVRTDPLGAYPVYRSEGWVSNSPAALAAVLGRPPLAADALAAVLGGGWSLGGGPLWEGIERVPWHAATPEGAREIAALAGAGFDAARATRLLVSGLHALADWPGRPNVVLVTGGRDSRLIAAAARRAGFDFVARTGGSEDAPDVVVAREVCSALGLSHGLLDPHPHGDFQQVWRDMARVLAATTGGTATLADASGFPLRPLGGPLPLWHTGQGGEIARGYYGAADEDELVRRFLGERPGRRSPLSDAGRERVAGALRAWAAEQAAAGARAEDLGDLFYLHQRMARWAAPTHAAVEPIRDSTSALWSWRLLPDLLGLPASERRSQGFHAAVLAELAPELLSLGYSDRATRGAGALVRKVWAELGRRAQRVGYRNRPPDGLDSPLDSSDPVPAALAAIRAMVAAADDHPAWQVLDRRRVDALLSGAPLDEMSRQYVWRLATVFAGFPVPDGPLAQ